MCAQRTNCPFDAWRSSSLSPMGSPWMGISCSEQLSGLSTLFAERGGLVCTSDVTQHRNRKRRMTTIEQHIRSEIRIPYGLRRVPASALATLLSLPICPEAGDIALARLAKIGKNARLELSD